MKQIVVITSPPINNWEQTPSEVRKSLKQVFVIATQGVALGESHESNGGTHLGGLRSTEVAEPGPHSVAALCPCGVLGAQWGGGLTHCAASGGKYIMVGWAKVLVSNMGTERHLPTNVGEGMFALLPPIDSLIVFCKFLFTPITGRSHCPSTTISNYLLLIRLKLLVSLLSWSLDTTSYTLSQERTSYRSSNDSVVGKYGSRCHGNGKRLPRRQCTSR